MHRRAAAAWLLLVFQQQPALEHRWRQPPARVAAPHAPEGEPIHCLAAAACSCAQRVRRPRRQRRYRQRRCSRRTGYSHSPL